MACYSLPDHPCDSHHPLPLKNPGYSSDQLQSEDCYHPERDAV